MIWSLSKFKDNIAVITESVSLTYGELDEQGKMMASVMPHHCLVFNFASNVLGAFFGYVSMLNNGIVQLVISDTMDSELRQILINTYHPSYLWIPTEKIDEFGYPSVIYEKFGYSLVKTELTPYPLAEDLAFLLTTSGSTGSPKLVRQTEINIRSNAEALVEYLELTVSERPMANLPMNYTYCISTINSHLLVGATILLTNRSVLEKEFWDFFKKEGATSFSGVPYTYEMLRKMRFKDMDLPSLRYFTQGGGKLIPKHQIEFAEYAEKTGRRFIIRYGQTEATSAVSYVPHQKIAEKIGSIGIPIPGGELMLLDADGNQITEPGVSGRLIYKGPNVTLGYAICGEDLSKPDERHGVLETGDLATMDADGYFYLVSREKRFLKIFGCRVSMDECETLIKTEFDIPCACVGQDDAMEIYITDENLKKPVGKFIAEKTGLNPVGFKVRYIPDIPRNDAGKTLYSALNNK